MEQKRLFLLDAYAIIFRAHYAFINNPRINSKGLDTSAIFGFVNTLDEILRKEKPSHIAVAFDPSGPTFRNEMYADYKANRDETPEGIKIAVPYIKKILEAYQIPILQKDGFEADDVIGTVAKAAEKQGFTVYMVTPDKDYCQLVSENIMMYKLRKGAQDLEIWGIKEVNEAFGTEDPKQVIDVLALWGDAADNIKGMPGVGEKRSKELIGQFKNIEGIYENLDQFKGKLKENLINFKEQLTLARELVTIDLNVPIEYDTTTFERKDFKDEKLEEVFNELEFKSLLKRIVKTEEKQSFQQTSLFNFPEENKQAESKPKLATIETTNHNYQLINSEEEIIALANMLKQQKEFCFDTETTSLDVVDAEIVGISFAFKAHEAYYIPMPENQKETQNRLNQLKSVFLDENISKIGQNIKYDIQILKNYSIEIKGNLHDTMIAHYLLFADQRHNMDALAEQYLGYSPVSIENLIGKKGSSQKNMRFVPLQQIKEYAAEDADITWQLYSILYEKIKLAGFTELYNSIEIPLIPVLATMELNGININTEELKKFGNELIDKIQLIEKEIYGIAGFEFNIGSPKQLGEVLFDRMKITDNQKKTKTQQYSTSEQELQKLADKHPIIDKILEYRSLKKLLNTYVESLPENINKKTGKIHTSFNQALVATGRLSSNNPNLQNIPIRSDEGKRIRQAFVAESDSDFIVSADYSQIELRIMAHLSGDKNLIEAFHQNKDIHRATAAKIYHINESEVSSEMRSKAKSANFGIIYGISSFGLAQNLRISRTEAKELIDGYFAAYPQVKEYMDAQIKQARENHFVETMFGRRRYLQEINSSNQVMRGVAERNAINAPIQGTAADIIKIAMIEIHRKIESQGLHSRMLLQVHDELVFNVKPDEWEKMQLIILEGMENAAKLSVPLKAEIGKGKNWLEAH
jgi:DNA polymerase-1